ncbi:TadE-like protein [Tistlia consotensis]|uniref:TadE-like protein n=1 Tax=Tistlia consotensis USBA 355 TaxID=560819 RepID=A0A1Y6BJE8_9PROT|nr:TadE/TadG family type IV pilus assembly protein [Tistlia consotensis]SMF12724.1 TadE-like protein [Tistlia consotensis USBA 355]SNR50923.1 TadE-like protein [Tistlia consotensis]
MLAPSTHRPPSPGFASLVRRFLRAREGVAAIEFAFVGMLIVVAAIGLIELAMILFVDSLMEGGLREAARYGVTGFESSGTTREAEVLAIVGQHTHGLVDMDKVQLQTLVYPGFADVGQPEPFTDENGNGQYDSSPAEPFVDVNGNGQWDADMGAAGLGGPGDIVLYTLRYDWPLMTGLLDDLIGQNGKMPLSASIIVRNEPFGTSGGGG